MAMAKAQIKLTEQWDGDQFVYFSRSVGGKRFIFNQNRPDSTTRAEIIGDIFERARNWTQSSKAAGATSSGPCKEVAKAVGRRIFLDYS